MTDGELKKLIIEAYTEADYSDEPFDSFTVMFNPEKYSQKYEVRYNDSQGAGDTASPQIFEGIDPQAYEFTFTLDGTGVTPNPNGSSDPIDVHDEIEHLLDVTGRNNGDIHRPPYLKISWGKLLFKGVMKTLDINYKLFKPDGTPLRVEIRAAFVVAVEDQERVAEAGNNSPDLTHARIVKDGDNLPLLTARIYRNPIPYYLQVAEVNNLNNFRRLKAGEQIIFPPVKKER